MGTSSRKLLAEALACLVLSGCSPAAESKNDAASKTESNVAEQAVSADDAAATAIDAPAVGPVDANEGPAESDRAGAESDTVAAGAPREDGATLSEDRMSDPAPAGDRPISNRAGGADSGDPPKAGARTDDANTDDANTDDANTDDANTDDANTDDANTDDANTDDADPDESQARRGNSPGHAKQPTALPDPVKQNGPIFQNWPDPKLALVLTGEQLGYIEPCGCAGLENQKGGLRRRHTFLKQLGDRGWPVIALDNGGLIRRFGRQAEIKFEKTAEALRTMDYQAVGFGTDDLKLPAGSVTSTVANSIFLSSNAALFGFDSEFTPRWRVIESGEMKVGVGQVLGDSLRKQVTNDEVQFVPAAKGLAEILPELKKARCDHYVLLAHATPEETRELALRFPLFDVVLMAHGADEPPHEAEVIDETGQLLIEVGHKGMYAITLGFYSDPATPMRYQRVPLDHRFADSPAMDELMVSYQDQLKELGWEGLGLRRVGHPRGKFVGSNQCADCHARAFEIWKDTPHAHATETLTQAKPPRQFDPECVSCHTTGWNAKEFMPYASGYDSLTKTADLAGNGCENCHGPGAAHVAAESGDDERLRDELRRAMHLSIEGADGEAVQTSCMECHDIDNSPKFKFETYWPLIAHPEK